MEDMNTENLKKATLALKQAIATYEHSDAEGMDLNYLILMRAGVVQNFEVAYDVARRTIEKWLLVHLDESAIAGTRKEIYQRAERQGLLDSAESWTGFHNGRNRSSHIYDETVALENLAVAKEFLVEAQKLVERIDGQD